MTLLAESLGTPAAVPHLDQYQDVQTFDTVVAPQVTVVPDPPFPSENFIYDPDHTDGPRWVYEDPSDAPNPDVADMTTTTYEPSQNGRVYTLVRSMLLHTLASTENQ